MFVRSNRPLSHGGHFESQESKKLCFCTSSLGLDERLDVQNLLFQQCVMKVCCVRLNFIIFCFTRYLLSYCMRNLNTPNSHPGMGLDQQKLMRGVF